ncbi:hypothetical protein SHAb15599_00158 [Acinetobacter phage SH-Ab 15599]|nr:hypothetical protein SHAb15599_00158 [Acinetobacter phage SH-Ab 15599]
MTNIRKDLSENVYIDSRDESLSCLPAMNYVKGDRWIYIAFDKAVDSAGGLFEVNDSSIEACDGGDARHFPTFSEAVEYIKACHYPFDQRMLNEYKHMLVSIDLFGPHLF